MNKPTHKTTPLGPRQRAAYIKPFRDELEKAKVTLAEQLKARAIASARLDKFRIPLLLRRATSDDTQLVSASEMSAYGLYLDTPAKKRAARKGLIEGTIKVQVGGGSSGAPNLVRRLRRMTKADQRRLRAIDARIEKARADREALIAEAFGRADSWTPDELAEFLIKRASIKGPAWIDSHVVIRAQQALVEAEKHDGTATCPCSPCDWGRKYAAQDKANAERRKEVAAA
jgi:hypothetical protein